MIDEMIRGLDDAKAVRVLGAIGRAKMRAGGVKEGEWTPELEGELERELKGDGEEVLAGTVSEGGAGEAGAPGAGRG